MLAFILVMIGVLSRVIAHAPNFTPVIALALFGGMMLEKRQALWMPLALMVISDMVIGLHQVIFFTWGSMLLISLLGYWQRENRSGLTVLGMSMMSAVVFFFVTNFGSWLAMYPHTVEGLIQCFVAGIPFFRNIFVSTLAYSAVLFGMHELVRMRVKDSRLAWIVSGI
ncbi:MAG TPA: DUF6580 family putative transport protein [Candidatus Bathyarchaeia archaeon]|nr:DUF6580 family putative transport protein [Candidatus Bathyarchaeia archaeon]